MARWLLMALGSIAQAVTVFYLMIHLSWIPTWVFKWILNTLYQVVQ